MRFYIVVCLIILLGWVGLFVTPRRLATAERFHQAEQKFQQASQAYQSAMLDGGDVKGTRERFDTADAEYRQAAEAYQHSLVHVSGSAGE